MYIVMVIREYCIWPICHAHLSALPSGSAIVAVVIRNHIVQLGSYLGSRPSSLLQGFCSCHKSWHNVIQQLKHTAQSGMILVTCTQSASVVLLLRIFCRFQNANDVIFLHMTAMAVPSNAVGVTG